MILHRSGASANLRGDGGQTRGVQVARATGGAARDDHHAVEAGHWYALRYVVVKIRKIGSLSRFFSAFTSFLFFYRFVSRLARCFFVCYNCSPLLLHLLYLLPVHEFFRPSTHSALFSLAGLVRTQKQQREAAAAVAESRALRRQVELGAQEKRVWFDERRQQARLLLRGRRGSQS